MKATAGIAILDNFEAVVAHGLQPDLPTSTYDMIRRGRA